MAHVKRANLKILIVDDEPVVLLLAEKILTRDGHEVVKAATAQEALRICGEIGIDLDLVLSDVQMPGMSGRDLAKCVSSLPKPTPLVLMSGYMINSPSVMRLVEDGKLDGVPFLQKPFTPSQLISVISDAIQRKGQVSN